jgi:type II restriction/modification system DNA methylase subunit YeeA
MNITDFIAKWRRSERTERSAAQEHFLDLCEVFEHPKPGDVDPTGESFTFERGATKQEGGKGWADVWKRNFFGWEYKGQHKDLNAAYNQLLQYREALENPPLLVVSDMRRIIIHTNFTATAKKTYEIQLEELGSTQNVEIVRALFHDPARLRPGATSVAITTEVAERLAQVARGLRGRGFDATDVARFLDRIVFCLFAEDVGLLPRQLFSRLAEKSRDAEHFARLVGQLFDAMRTGGDFGLDEIKHFNGNLFTDSPVLPLTGEEIKSVQAAARVDWSAVDPSVFGTLFERGLDPDTRAQLGAQYTSRADIETLIEPVVLAPLRREWGEARARIEKLLAASGVSEKTRREREREARAVFRDYHERLSHVRVLDPACGSGNFLYVTLQKLKDLEKEVLVYGSGAGLGSLLPQVNPTQFYGIELNPYAFDLAQTTLWIGYLQWITANGYGTPAEPILRTMNNFFQMDAILDRTDPANPREPEWQPVDFIVGNPPFLGDKRMRGELGDEYVEALRRLYKGRVPGGADLVTYWFEKARKQIEEGKAKRAGLIATQGIRGGANREVLKRIKETGDIFFAVADRDWVLDGATVHVSMVGFDAGEDKTHTLDGREVQTIHGNLTGGSNEGLNTTQVRPLAENAELCFLGVMKAGAFDIPEADALEMANSPTPHGMPNSDVLRPRLTARDILHRAVTGWIIDFGCDTTSSDASLYESPWQHLELNVRPERLKNRRPRLASHWWIHGECRPGLRRALTGLSRFIVTPEVSKHRIFVWLDAAFLADHQTRAFARADDYFFGVLHSRIHELWARSQGTQLREKESGFRYTPTTCFETFPFPTPSPEQQDAIAAAARSLDELRQRWLNPPEWTRTETLEFPGSNDGAWSRYVHDADERGVGTVRYPRTVARDEEAARQLSKRTLTNLYNQRPAWLANAHAELDAAVATAYGFPADLTDEDILARLLELNRQRA